MPDLAPEVQGAPQGGFREATCIHTRKVYDSCQSKDCIEDLRLYPTASSQSVIDTALSLKTGKAELLYVYLSVQPIGMGRGFYTIDMRYYYRITIDAAVSCASTVPITGLAIFEKRCALFGSEGSARSFTSAGSCEALDGKTLPTDSNLPIAVCEAVDPLILSMKLVDACDMPCSCETPANDLPPAILAAFGGEKLVFHGNNTRRIYFTLGQFSILRLERDSQLLIPVYDYCMPKKECCCNDREEDPCQLFQQVNFPVGEFFPPATVTDVDPMERIRNGCFHS